MPEHLAPVAVRLRAWPSTIVPFTFGRPVYPSVPRSTVGIRRLRQEATMSIEARTNSKGDRRYEVRLRDPSGREYSRTFRTKKEAEHFEDTQRADRARGGWVDPRTGDVAFGAWAKEWLASNPGKSPSALARDETILRVHLLPT